MIKKYSLLVFLALQITFLSAQVNSSSPYSRYGIGDISNNGFGQSQAMGGIGIGTRSNKHINVLNPASYSSIDSLAFLFEFGLGNQYKTFSTADGTSASNYANLQYIALEFPITKWWAGSAGIMPYSNIGYNLKNTSALSGLDTVETFYNGDGGVNQFYFGNSFTPFDNFSVGANVSYLFGSLNQLNSVIFKNDNDATDIFIEKQTYIGDFNFEFGAQYTIELKKESSLTVGATYGLLNELSASQNMVTTGIVTSGGTSAADTLAYFDNEAGSITIPTKIGFGLSYVIKDKLIIGADYSMQDWSEAKVFGVNDSLTTSSVLRLGLEYTPDWKSSLNYYKRISYRAGLKYDNTYLNINGNQISDIGISFGVGLPLRKTQTSLNIAFELGQRGTTANNLLKENYAKFSLNLTLADKWFKKKKFN